MMRKLFLLALLTYIGAMLIVDQYKVGDCFYWREDESRASIQKVVRVNSFTYDTQYWLGWYWSGQTKSFKITERLFSEGKITCPK